MCYVERPLTTAMTIVLPRVLQRRWSRASRFVVEIGVYPRKEVPTVCHALLTIPVVVLYIPFHVRCFPDPRLDSPSQTPLRLFIGNMRHLCAGCERPLGRKEVQFCCHFGDTGFKIKEFEARPCQTQYHPECIRMGLPFVTRLPKDGGMHCPRDLAAFAHFICEACTVRLVLQRELSLYPSDTVLLMLERARLIDLTNHWARGTLKAYQSKFSILDEFSRDLHVSVLTLSTLAYPPNGEAIPLMWAQERYSLYPSEWHRRVSAKTDPVKFGSVRAIRSAASHFWIWDLLLAHPDRLTLGFKDPPVVVEGCSPTDEAAYTSSLTECVAVLATIHRASRYPPSTPYSLDQCVL
jgi:hypothetical protein